MRLSYSSGVYALKCMKNNGLKFFESKEGRCFGKDSGATTMIAVIMHNTEVASNDQTPQYPIAVSIRASVIEKIIQLLAIMIFAFWSAKELS